MFKKLFCMLLIGTHLSCTNLSKQSEKSSKLNGTPSASFFRQCSWTSNGGKQQSITYHLFGGGKRQVRHRGFEGPNTNSKTGSGSPNPSRLILVDTPKSLQAQSSHNSNGAFNTLSDVQIPVAASCTESSKLYNPEKLGQYYTLLIPIGGYPVGDPDESHIRFKTPYVVFHVAEVQKGLNMPGLNPELSSEKFRKGFLTLTGHADSVEALDFNQPLRLSPKKVASLIFGAPIYGGNAGLAQTVTFTPEGSYGWIYDAVSVEEAGKGPNFMKIAVPLDPHGCGAQNASLWPE
jgi:hypothetical protein